MILNRYHVTVHSIITNTNPDNKELISYLSAHDCAVSGLLATCLFRLMDND